MLTTRAQRLGGRASPELSRELERHACRRPRSRGARRRPHAAFPASCLHDEAEVRREARVVERRRVRDARARAAKVEPHDVVARAMKRDRGAHDVARLARAADAVDDDDDRPLQRRRRPRGPTTPSRGGGERCRRRARMRSGSASSSACDRGGEKSGAAAPSVCRCGLRSQRGTRKSRACIVGAVSSRATPARQSLRRISLVVCAECPPLGLRLGRVSARGVALRGRPVGGACSSGPRPRDVAGDRRHRRQDASADADAATNVPEPPPVTRAAGRSGKKPRLLARATSRALAIDATNVYFGNSDDDGIYAVAKGGGEPTRLARRAPVAGAIAVDADVDQLDCQPG